MFNSWFETHKLKSPFPAYAGTRVMMMPFVVRDPGYSLPDTLRGYVPMVEEMVAMAGFCNGVGYLTVDEASLRAGEHHRRPGRHVDGIDELGGQGGWSRDGGGWGVGGMVLASSVYGCDAWEGVVDGMPGPDGDCAGLEVSGRVHPMLPGNAYVLDGMTVHESVPVEHACRRQFIRVSGPSDAAWYEGYTKNPLGILPTGEIRPRRPGMDYRP